MIKRLLMDLETSPNVVLSWRIGHRINLSHDNIIKERAIITAAWKWQHQKKIYALTWDKNQNDKKLLQDFLPVLEEADEVVAHFGCVTPGHRVLTSDLRWVPVETLEVGDELLSVDQSEERVSFRRFRYKKTKVTFAQPMQKEVFEIKLSDGRALVATKDHPWLVKRGGLKLGGRHTWRNTSELNHFNCKEPRMMQALPVWESLRSRSSGYIAGFIDSEGSIIQGSRKGRNDYSFSISASQHAIKNRDVLEKAISSLDDLGWKYSVHPYDPEHPEQQVVSILGGNQEKISFLGSVRPAKISRLDVDRLGTVQEYRSFEIIEIKPLGVQTVIGLSTENQTYIVEGFISHNSGFDIPWIKTRALYHGLNNVYNYKVIDTKEWAARYCNFNSNSLDYLAQYLKVGTKIKTEYDLWKDIVLKKDPVALAKMVKYNKHDVAILEPVYEKLSLLGPLKTHAGVFEGREKWTCPRCASSNVRRSKKYVTSSGTVQRQMKCNDCSRYYNVSARGASYIFR